MWTTLITALIPTFLRGIEYFIEAKVQSKEARQAYLDFINTLEPHLKNSARMRQSYDRQKARLDEMVRNADSN